MSRHVTTTRLFLLCAWMALTGCRPIQPFYLHEDGDLSHYINKATRAEHPDVNVAPLPEVSSAEKPLTITNPEPREMWDLHLEDCVSMALANSKVIRGGQAARLQNGQLTAGTNEGSLVLNPRAFASSYNPAVVESNPGIINDAPNVDGGTANIRQGVEAALSEFDAQFSVIGNGPNQQFLGHTDRPQNIPSGAAFGLPKVQTTNGGMTTQLTKKTIEGTQFTIRNSNGYDRGLTRPSTFQPLTSVWTSTMEAEFRHPLLRGRGAQINRMPIMIARIGNDIEIMALQGQLQDMLNNIEIRYWDLHFAYRTLETTKVGRDSALNIWRIVYDKKQAGAQTTQEEAQAREQYFSFRAQVENALRNLYDTENELRLLMGLAATDGRLIRPIDEPTFARVNFEWTDVLAEAVARRPELISKRWEIKQRELELIWARNRLLPQLDVGGVYRWVGMGDDLINANRTGLDFPQQGSTAYEELFGGKYQEWGVFFNYTMPVGFRRELAGVRHAQLRLARDKAVLEDMELDVSTGLAKAIRNLDTNYQLVNTNANRWVATRQEVEAVQASYDAGRTALDLVLEAQRRRALAQNAFWNSVAEYNKSIADLHTRKGSIMEYNNVAFEEGPWPQKAYWDAMARARERDAGHYIDYGFTRPAVVSRGEIPQGAPLMESMPGEMSEGTVIEESAPEALPPAKSATPSAASVPSVLKTSQSLAPAAPRGSATGVSARRQTVGTEIR